RELLGVALLGALEDVLERDLAARAARQRLGLEAVLALAGEAAGGPGVLGDADGLARGRGAVEAQHPDGLARRRRGDALTHVVVHCADAAPVRTGDDRVADLQGAALDQQRDDRAAARVEL